MNQPRAVPRVFADTNVFIEALVAPWSASRAVFVLARLRIFKLLLSPYVAAEIEEFLLRRLAHDYAAGSDLIDAFQRLLVLLEPERLDKVLATELRRYRTWIRHGNDVPVLVTALLAKPDWLITANTEHFNEEVATRTGLRIVTPHEFLHLFKLDF